MVKVIISDFVMVGVRDFVVVKIRVGFGYG